MACRTDGAHLVQLLCYLCSGPELGCHPYVLHCEASHHTPWSHVESLYFSVVTLTTVGLGDYVPDTEAGAKFLFFWASVGLGILATFLTNLSEGIAGVGDRMKFIPFLAFSGAGSRDKSKFRERGDTEFSTSKDTVI